MGKRCAVTGCQSGRSASHSQKLGLREFSLFGVPKSESLRRQWQTALQMILHPGEFVCELHFAEHSIKKTDDFRLPDGVIHCLPRLRYKLNEGAIPINYDQETIPSCSNQCDTYDHRTKSDLPGIVSLPNLQASEVPSDDIGNHPVLTLEIIKAYLRTQPLLEGWAYVFSDRSINLIFIDRYTLKSKLHLVIEESLSVLVWALKEKKYHINETIASIGDIAKCCNIVAQFETCRGINNIETEHVDGCSGFIDAASLYQIVSINPRSLDCRYAHQQRIRERRSRFNVDRDRCVKKKSEKYRRKFKIFKHKVNLLKNRLNRTKVECANVEEKVLRQKIDNLDAVQQQAVLACFSAAKASNSKGRRYTLQWIYECLLMRIKGSGLYDSMRARNILPLPCKVTLNKYIQKISSSAFGFQTAIFDCLQVKGRTMEPCCKRGVLMVDEMKLSESISFNKSTMDFHGFVDLGQYTPHHQKNTRADHALVFMFQPFRGSWVQVLGCFLSKDAATSDVLHKLLLDCVILLGNIGFHVDVITSDGAQWNRGVWRLFGIDETHLSCEHPCDWNKRLWMISDFPHLIKCFRNGIMKSKIFETPDGIVKKDHWAALLNQEKFSRPNLKIAYKLTPDHLDPKGYQTMNVQMAFDLFSQPIWVAMATYRDVYECPQLRDSHGTEKFITRVGSLIKAMMSRTPKDAIRAGDICSKKKAIADFKNYLQDWIKLTQERNQKLPISSSTRTGLLVTLGSTLEIIKALSTDDFQYLMTSRLTQDPLERFFGIMRSACGSNDHPDPQLFAQVFRLLCCYSLVKPPNGSNVTGTELLETLMQTKDSLETAASPRIDWLQKIDRVLDGHCFDSNTDTSNQSQLRPDGDADALLVINRPSTADPMVDHTYDVARTNDEVQAFIAGYVVRKMMRSVKCQECLNSLQLLEDDPSDVRMRVIQLMDNYGGLLYPSDCLFSLLQFLEYTILDVVGKYQVDINLLNKIIDKLFDAAMLSELPSVGCDNHKKIVTLRVIDFYIVMRAHFLCKSFNLNNDANKRKTKMHRKQSKL